ncbi:MAG: hypothetical protein ACTSR8_16730 [Promethearchaeota archaeon]
MYNKKVIGILLFLIMICGVSTLILSTSAEETEKFDPKLQVTEYLSFNIDIVDQDFNYLDNDDDLDMIIAHEDMIEIYENSNDGYSKEWEIFTGTENFIDEDSSIVAIASGNVLGRDNPNIMDNITSITTYDGCSIKSPSVYNQSYLTVADDINYYNITYDGVSNGTIYLNVQLPIGIYYKSTTLNIRMRDNYSSSIDEASLQIFQHSTNKWYEWVSLKNIANSFNTLTSSSENLALSIREFIPSNNHTLKFRFWYNDSNPISIGIDYFDLSSTVLESQKDIIIGGEKGEIYLLTSYNSDENIYKVVKSIALNQYDTIGDYTDEEFKEITTILCGDIEDDGTDEIIFGNNHARIFALNWTNNAFTEITIDDYEGIEWDLSGGGFTKNYNTIFSMAILDKSSEFVLFIGTKQKSIYTISFNYISNKFSGLLSEVNLVSASVREIVIGDVIGNSNEDIVISAVDGTVLVFSFNNQNYGDPSAYSEEYNSEDLIKSPSYANKIAIGDFEEEDTNTIALGTTQTKKKVQVLKGDSDFKLYWDSDTYIREDIKDLNTISDSGVDTLVVASERRIFFLSKKYDDTDKDKLSNLNEKLFYLTDPKEEDTDSDGLNDGVEIFVYKTDPLNYDTDGDLIPDGWEVSLGTDPLDPLSSIILIILFPLVIALSAITVFIIVKKSRNQKRAEYAQVKNTPNLLPQIRRLIIQRLETFAKEHKGFQSKNELSRFRKNISMELIVIVLDRLYNFLEYLRLKGIIFSDRQERILREILNHEIKPVEEDLDKMLKALLMYETKYKQFKEEFLKVLSKYEDWKKPATKAKGKIIVEELVKCPKCNSLQPKGSAFCLECGGKIV